VNSFAELFSIFREQFAITVKACGFDC